jgi:hypothetical protein
MINRREEVIDRLERTYRQLFLTLQEQIDNQSPDSNFFLALRCGVVSSLGAIEQYKTREKI